jgi:very-short-patch-repair endonuclease
MAHHCVYKTVETVFRAGNSGITEQLMCKLCWRSEHVAVHELQLAAAVDARLPGMRVVSQAVLVGKKAVDLWWPGCSTVAEVDGSSHDKEQQRDRHISAQECNTRATRDAAFTTALQEKGYTVFRFQPHEVNQSTKLDALVQHLLTAKAN